MPNLSIELLQPHTHAGQRLPAGARLDLPETSARWLIAQGVARLVTPESSIPSLKSSRRDGPAAAASSTGD
ncbi:MAG: hypothetical protein ACK4TK_04315 [Thiobacillaceae bacterium]|uniref:DUF7210 family protein n=1 Tax=Caldimonas manganoxidans TaxID=196015 RepID=UPI00037984C9|nr:hypothetical protein [Caldimonas manganoxidans]